MKTGRVVLFDELPRLPEEDNKLMIGTVRNLVKRTFCMKETVCTIIADKYEAAKVAEETIAYHRKLLESYIKTHTAFLHSLRPLEIDDGPEVVKLMASASAEAGVGPMASVAGALADLAVEAMLSCGAKTAIIENGGKWQRYLKHRWMLPFWLGTSRYLENWGLS